MRLSEVQYREEGVGGSESLWKRFIGVVSDEEVKDWGESVSELVICGKKQ